MRHLYAVHQVASVRIRDSLPSEGPAPDAHSQQPGSDPFTAVDGTCSSEAAVVVKSIMLRAAFGGMAGDVEMLNAFAPAWQNRCASCLPRDTYRCCVNCPVFVPLKRTFVRQIRRQR